jgi:hypothetical protein
MPSCTHVKVLERYYLQIQKEKIGQVFTSVGQFLTFRRTFSSSSLKKKNKKNVLVLVLDFGFKKKNWNPTSGYGLGLQQINSGG